MSLPSLDDSELHDLAGRSAALDAVMKVVAQDLVFVALLLGLLLWLRRDALRAGTAACLGAGGALALSGLIGLVWDRPRPFVAEHFAPLLAHGADASFPSDHVIVLAALGGAAWFASRLISVASLGLAALTGLARDYVGVHWLSDVLASLVIGIACGMAAWQALKPAVPLIERLDMILARHRLRPRLPG